MPELEEWKPGSFTKNYSWGPRAAGLQALHEAIRVGFDGEVVDTQRSDFRARIARLNRPDFIPMNFFLFNKIQNGIDYLVADELVFQAINYEHSDQFDRLALLCFNLSYAGKWRGSAPYQRRPALWAHHYILDRVAKKFNWNTALISADDIDNFVSGDPRYIAQGSRKLATNLNYLYVVGKLSEFSSPKIERWWVDGAFLALDRIISDRGLDGAETNESQYQSLLNRSHFPEISGKRGLEKDLASKHLVTLYAACGGPERFSVPHVEAITELKLPEVNWLLANDVRPKAAVHPTNAQIIKSIPWACAWLAKYAGFDVIDADELATFDSEEFIRRRTKTALKNLQDRKIQPNMSADELMRITRER